MKNQNDENEVFVPEDDNEVSWHDRFKTLMSSIMILGASYLLGHWIVSPVFSMMKDKPFVYFRDMIIGLNVGFLIFLLGRRIYIAYCNRQTRNGIKDILPSTVAEAEKLGIKSPVDFCVAMTALFTYEHKTPYAVTNKSFIECTEEEAWQKSVQLFEQMFHRKPMSYDEYGIDSWSDYAYLEVQKQLGKKEDDNVEIDELLNILSPALKDHFKIGHQANILTFGTLI